MTMGVIVNVRGSSDNIVRSATVKICDKTYDRPIQRLYLLHDSASTILNVHMFIL